jgi:hypothetical protein
MAIRQRAVLRPPVMTPQAVQSSKNPGASRVGKRGVTFYLPEDEWKQLRRLSVDTDATIQDLMEEATGLLLAKRQLKPVAKAE